MPNLLHKEPEAFRATTEWSTAFAVFLNFKGNYGEIDHAVSIDPRIEVSWEVEAKYVEYDDGSGLLFHKGTVEVCGIDETTPAIVKV